MARGTVLVTGTSTGIGRATAAELAERGFRVLAGVRKESDAEAVRALSPERIEPLILDVTDRDAVAALPDSTGGDLVGLVNNAGVSMPGPLEYLPMEDVRHQIEVMLLAPFARQELAPLGVHVALVEPGSIKTEIWDKGVESGQKLLDALPEEGRRVYGERLR